jgi:sigma-B regulation protein RsbU (phosphoserine phosphatase)
MFARVHPAREVSGDLYDYFALPDGRLAFYLGDVSGKGMPAALFMIAVRSLGRHLAPAASGPADWLRCLNEALVADNPTALFVTLAVGMLDPRDGVVRLASGGHPAPLLRHADGTVEDVAVKPGLLIGSTPVNPVREEAVLQLGRGDTLVLYTDGYTEAFGPDGQEMFGKERLSIVLAATVESSLEECAATASASVERFTGKTELQDDQTLLLLRMS